LIDLDINQRDFRIGFWREQGIHLSRVCEIYGYPVFIIYDLATYRYTRRSSWVRINRRNPILGFGDWSEEVIDRVSVCTQVSVLLLVFTINYICMGVCIVWIIDIDIYVHSNYNFDIILENLLI